jgi:hypothetical protein
LGVIAGTLLTALISTGESQATRSTKMLMLAKMKDYAWLIGIVGAVCTRLVTFLGPINKAERYWCAYHVLDQACIEYEQEVISMGRFLSRVRQARAILQASDPSESNSLSVAVDKASH